MNTSINKFRPALVMGALGVVYGDIGTSPLYALRECLERCHGGTPSSDSVMGIVSLIVWSLTLIVSIKYIAFILRADNKGEGGILALLSLAVSNSGDQSQRRNIILIGVGLFGAALLYGDGIITPAITVLGAVEGMELATSVVHPYIIPLAVLVLIGLFTVQRLGTGKVGSFFGPIMLLWFLVLAILGIRGILMAPQILKALSPHYALAFLIHNSKVAFIVLGTVFLAVTGAEALYADMGHFGIRPIRSAWHFIVFPSLVLNYFGEGALVLANPEAIKNPFFMLAPSWALMPLVGLSTMAAVIASQALISGAYSLTMQAIQMGYLPRLHIQHTSHSEKGQIYMPQVNTFLMVACIGLVLGFQSSSHLAGAYGIAVSMTMLCTSLLFYQTARRLWNWHWLYAGLVCAAFILMEATFVVTNGLKMFQGGWFPLLIGIMIFTMMTTWKRGRQLLRRKLNDNYMAFDEFLPQLDDPRILRVPGTAVYLSGNPVTTPIALLHSLRHYKALHKRLIILSIQTCDTPSVKDEHSLKIEKLRPDVYRVTGYYGFMEQPDVIELLEDCAKHGIEPKPMETTFFLSRETIVSSEECKPEMAGWRRRLFAAMSRNAQSATAFFQLPPNRVVELGMQVQL